MKTRSYLIPPILFLGVVLLATFSCQKEASAPTLLLLPNQIDSLFTAEEIAILSKQLDIEKFDYIRNVPIPEQYKIFLGRVLFYDTHLSEDESVSCSSCHQQKYAFADNVAFSRGANGNVTDRNSISLASFGSFAAHYEEEDQTESLVENSFFWDERVGELNEQMLETFANPKEMGMELAEIGRRVENLDYAKVLHDRAFQGQPVTTHNVVEAIGAFVNSINSTASKFDTSFLFRPSIEIKEDFLNFDESQNNGKKIFLEKCASCHAFSLEDRLRGLFDNLETTASNGLDLEYSDIGLATHTSLAEHNGVFKIPGLRNISLTAPYMHDGRFATIEEVIEFYSTGIQAHPNLSDALKDENGAPIRMNFTEQEKQDLTAFLETLTGLIPLLDEELSNPFK